MVRSSALVLLWLISTGTTAQDRYMVFFKDKANSAYSAEQPLAFLSASAISRRQKNSVPVTEQDFPVNASYVSGVATAGATPLFSTRWFNGVLVLCESSLLPTLQALPYVARVELAAPGTIPVSTARATYLSYRPGNSSRAQTATQLTMIGLDQMHAQNFRGEGIKIAVFDAGFPGVNTVAAFEHLQDNIRDTYSFVNRKSDVYANDDHGTEVLSVMAGYLESTFTGGVYNADYYLYHTEHAPDEYRIEEYNWLFAAERADSAGVDVINASLGYNTFDNTSMNYTKAQLDGQTAVVTRAAQAAADRGILVVVSAGNEGSNSWRLITPPADAREVLATGSVTSTGTRSSFSSVGRTSDGRIKPDLCTMGTGTFVVRQNGNTGTANGTSLASPLLASLVAGLVQKYNTVPKERIVQALRFTASQANMPDSLLGYGIPNFSNASLFLDLATGVEPPVSDYFEVYPNPTDSGGVYIRSREYGRPVAVQVLDANGREVKNDAFTPTESSPTTLIKLEKPASGLVLIRVTVGDHTEIFRIVKER